MIITAKWNGVCAKCGHPTRRGEEIDYVNKKAYHPSCAPIEQEEDGRTPEAFALADRLGYADFTWSD